MHTTDHLTVHISYYTENMENKIVVLDDRLFMNEEGYSDLSENEQEKVHEIANNLNEDELEGIRRSLFAICPAFSSLLDPDGSYF